MSGYTPIFGSIIRGTLCGKWPDIGLWGVLLAMADWRGEIDATPQYIATVTGLDVGEVAACIERFCAPDPGSRSQAERGARLVHIDPARSWGWRVVNIQKYRAKAAAANQVADGRNAEKVRRYKERHRRTPEDTRGHQGKPYSYSYSDKEKREPDPLAGGPTPETPINPGLDPSAWSRWIEYREGIKKPLRSASIAAAQKKLASFGAHQNEVVEQSIANGWQGLFELKDVPARKPKIEGL